MSAPSPAALPAPPSGGLACEIWIRNVGRRRQAFYREPHVRQWRPMQVAHAEKALRTGVLDLRGLGKFAVVPRETTSSETPAVRAFEEIAQWLDRPQAPAPKIDARQIKRSESRAVSSPGATQRSVRSHHGAKVVLTSVPGAALGGAA